MKMTSAKYNRNMLTEDNIVEQSSMIDFLRCHELQEGHVVLVQAGRREVALVEYSQAVLEQGEFHKLLVETQVKGLEIEVGHGLEGGRRIKASTANRSGHNGRCRRNRRRDRSGNRR